MTLKISQLKEVDSLRSLQKEKRPVVESLKFEVYVEKEEQELYQAMNCHKDGGLKITQQVKYYPNMKENSYEGIYFYVSFWLMKELKIN